MSLADQFLSDAGNVAPSAALPLSAQFAMDAQAKQPAAPQQMNTASLGLGDSIIQGIKNVPSSAEHFLGGIWNAVSHPVDTVGALKDLGVGAVQNLALNAINEENANRARRGQAPVSSIAERYVAHGNTPEMGKADAVGQFYKNRYGGIDNIGNTLVNDPVGALADASMVGGLAGGAAKMAGLTKTGQVIGDVSNAVNPINISLSIAKPVVSTAGDLTSKIAKNLLGLTTGVGPENIAAAAKAGYAGDNAFIKNLSGESDMTDILGSAKQALQTMRNTRSSDYKSGIASTAADTTKLDFSPIDVALQKVTDSMKSGNHWKIGDAEVNKVKEVSDIVGEWKSDPSMHTAMGLDALKQRLDAVYPDSPIHNQAQRAITAVRGAVKNTIVDQSPEYAGTMKGYEEAIGLEKEIERALSLGNKASADTALRKLQSLSRNNVNTNYGYRLDLAKALQDQGGQSLMPAIAGQAMNSWTPRGVAGQGGMMASLGASLHNPAMLGVIPLQSPRAVGAALYGGGRLAGMGATAADYMKSKIPLSPAELQKLATVLSASGNLPKD